MGAEKHCTRSRAPQGPPQKKTYATQGKEALSLVRQNRTSRRRADDTDGVKGLLVLWADYTLPPEACKDTARTVQKRRGLSFRGPCSSAHQATSGDATVKGILLTQGEIAVVDDEDYGWLSEHS
jgi:hypothetical protein